MVQVLFANPVARKKTSMGLRRPQEEEETIMDHPKL